jgi:hypothetical protein
MALQPGGHTRPGVCGGDGIVVEDDFLPAALLHTALTELRHQQQLLLHTTAAGMHEHTSSAHDESVLQLALPLELERGLYAFIARGTNGASVDWHASSNDMNRDGGLVELSGQVQRGDRHDHADVTGSGSIVNGRVGLLYLSGQGALVFTDVVTGQEYRVKIAPNRAVSWPNAQHTHRVEAAPGHADEPRLMIGPHFASNIASGDGALVRCGAHAFAGYGMHRRYKQRTPQERKQLLCTFDGDAALVTQLKCGLLTIVVMAMWIVSTLAMQANPLDSCSLTSDGSISHGDSCCLQAASWDNMIATVRRCGKWTIVESAVILVFIGSHICYMAAPAGPDCCRLDDLIKKFTGACGMCVGGGFAIPALVNLVELWTSFDDLSKACDGNEDWNQVERTAILPLTIVHSAAISLAICTMCLPLCGLCSGIEVEKRRDPTVVEKAQAAVGPTGAMPERPKEQAPLVDEAKPTTAIVAPVVSPRDEAQNGSDTSSSDSEILDF